MHAAVVEFHFGADQHLAGFLGVETQLHTRPVWTEHGEQTCLSNIYLFIFFEYLTTTVYVFESRMPNVNS